MKNNIKKFLPPFLGKWLKLSWLSLRGLYYHGHRYQCPVCGYNFRKMLLGGFDLPVIAEKQIVGGGRRENDICPYCQSTDRDRLVYLYLKYETDFFDRKQFLLHIAPEPSLFRIFKNAPTIDYFPATKYAEGLYYSNKTKMADLLDLHIDGESFDWVICNHVLEHIPDDIQAMREIFRVLKPGGRAILQVPYSKVLDRTFENPEITKPSDREKFFGQFDHVRIYAKDYPERLKLVGFEVNVIQQKQDFLHIPDLKKFAVNPEENLFLCSKPDYRTHTL